MRHSLILPRRKLLLAAPALVLPYRRSKAQMLQGVIAGGNIPTPPFWTLIAATSAGFAGSYPITSGAINTTGANLILVVQNYVNTSITPAAFTDSKSNTYTNFDAGYSPGGLSSGSFTNLSSHCISPTVGSGHTFTMSISSGSGGAGAFAVAAFKSASGTPFYDLNGGAGTGEAFATSGTSFSLSSITPSINNDLAYIPLLENSSGNTFSMTGFSIATQLASSPGNHLAAAIAYAIQSGTGAFTPTWTISSSTSGASSRGFVMGSV